MDRQDLGRPRPLIEVEVADQVAELAGGLADPGSRVGAPVGGRVEALSAEEVVLDELGVVVVA
jgi:hypothetical protein